MRLRREIEETEADIEGMQALLDRSFLRAGPHQSAIITPERRLTARQVVRYLQGVKQFAVGTVSSRGEPRVSFVDCFFLQGRLYFSTDGGALRVRHLRRNDAISATHGIGDELAITLHGHAEVISDPEHPQAKRVAAIFEATYGYSAYSLADDIVFVRIDPEIMVTFAQHPENYPE